VLGPSMLAVHAAEPIAILVAAVTSAVVGVAPKVTMEQGF